MKLIVCTSGEYILYIIHITATNGCYHHISSIQEL